MKKQESSKNWISVKSQLPGFYTRVKIAEMPRGSSEIVYVISEEAYLTQFGDWSELVDGNPPIHHNLHCITHWMPLND